MADRLTLSVKKLFGSFDYELSLVKGSSPLVITAPNGYGKTTLLTILNNLRLGNLIYFWRLQFSEIHLKFGENFNLCVKSLEGDISESSESIEDSEESNIEHSVVFEVEGQPNTRLELSRSRLIEIIRQPSSIRFSEVILAVLDQENSLVANTDLLLENYAEDILAALSKTQDSSLVLSLASLPQVVYIKADRLTRDKSEELRFKHKIRGVNEISREEEIYAISQALESQLNIEYRKYLAISQKSDKEFVNNLLHESEDISKEDYELEVKAVEKKIKTLVGYGLVNKFTLPEYHEQKSFVLKAYLKDLNTNFASYDTIVRKLNLFIELINKKQMTRKTITVTRKSGLRAVSEDGSFLRLETLSSGEKNQIILLYDLIFCTPANSVLLVDEPELSLHVAWQMDYLEELEDIAKRNDLMVIVATHSPHIIGERWEQCYDLYEATNDRDNNE
ncbi:MAG: AAA family ATPase [Muribaculaceae bacterium]|nr:AAA family ATPase [Muribaculaceae bacterium]